jgi:hypothetical protein
MTSPSKLIVMNQKPGKTFDPTLFGARIVIPAGHTAISLFNSAIRAEIDKHGIIIIEDTHVDHEVLIAEKKKKMERIITAIPDTPDYIARPKKDKSKLKRYSSYFNPKNHETNPPPSDQTGLLDPS